MALPVSVPYTFGSTTTQNSLVNLDSNFSTIYTTVNTISTGATTLATPVIATSLGIGTSSPSQALSVVGGISATSTVAMGSSFLRNRIINGAMQVSQRGTIFTSPANATYTLDRFWIYWTGAAPASVAQVAGPTGYQYALQITGAASNTAVAINQSIESNNIADLASTTVTLSATILASTAQTVLWAAYYPTVTDNYSSKTFIASGTWSVTTFATIWTAQIALPSNVVNGLQIVIFPNNGGAFTSGTLTVTGVQVEPGSIATPFERKTLSEVLAQCQRYYYSTGVGVIKLNAYVGASAPSPMGTLFLPVTMRATPTVVYNSTSYSNCSGITTEVYVTTQAVSTYVTGTANGPASVIFGYTTSAEL
jgi:hypothetical protein